VGIVSYPVLYEATETDFSHGGFGFLSDCIQCEVTEEANGEFELYMRYPIDGIHFEDIANNCIIKVRLDKIREPQRFRIYSISKPLSKVVTVKAHHISYDLSGIPVSPFSASTVQGAMAGLKTNSAVDSPFEFWTDKESAGTFNVSVPSSVRSKLGGGKGSILDVFGGEYEFDNYTVKLYNSRGEDRGFAIRYGKNLLDINQEENVSSVVTGVYPYWSSSDGSTVIQLPEKIVNAHGTYDFVRILPLDLSNAFSSKPTETELRTFAENYVQNNNIGVPSVSLSVSFAQIDQSEEYRHLNLFERMSLFDTILVEFPMLKVSTRAKVVKIVHDVLLDRIKSAQVGSTQTNIADTIANMQSSQKKNL
jgi:phage minor structural protein